MNRRTKSLLVAAGIAAVALLLPGSVRAHAEASAPAFLGAWPSPDSPYAIAVNPQGDVWVAYADTPRLARYDTAGHQQLTVPLDPSDHPLGIATDAAGNAYVTDDSNSTVLEYSRTGSLVSTWSNVVDSPGGIALDSSGNVFVTDGAADLIRKFTSGGAGSGTVSASTQIAPGGLATDTAGNIYVTDTEGDNILKLSPSGGTIGTFGTGFGSGDGQFDIAAYDAVGPGGNVFATDENNHRIQEFGPTGTFLNAWGTGGGGDGQFTNPLGIAVDVAGNVYVADEGNARIEKFFTGLDPCTNLFAPHLGACQAARTACMAKLVPQDEASCLNAAEVQYDAFRGQRAVDGATASAKPAEASTNGRIVVKVRLTAAGAPAAGKKVRLAFSLLRGRLGSLHATPASAVTSSAGSAAFTLTTTAPGAGTYRVGVVDVTDGKTFANLTTVRFG